MKILNYLFISALLICFVSCLNEEDDGKNVSDNPEIASKVIGVWRGDHNFFIDCMYLREDRTMVNGHIYLSSFWSGFYSSWRIDGKNLYVWNDDYERYQWWTGYDNNVLVGINGNSLEDVRYSKIYDPVTGKSTYKLPELEGYEFTGDCAGGMIALAFGGNNKVVRTDTNGKTGISTEREYIWKIQDNVIRFSDDKGATWLDDVWGIGVNVGKNFSGYVKAIFVDLGDVYTLLTCY